MAARVMVVVSSFLEAISDGYCYISLLMWKCWSWKDGWMVLQ